MKTARRTYQTIDLNANFVLSGRGSQVYNWAGNLKMRNVTASYLGAYMSNHNQRAKSRVINEIVRRLDGMIFVRQRPLTSQWLVLTKKDARRKVAHAMRDLVGNHQKAPVVEEPITTEEEPSSSDDNDSVDSEREIFLVDDIVSYDQGTTTDGWGDISWFVGGFMGASVEEV